MNVLVRAMPYGTLQVAARHMAIDRLAEVMEITCTPEELQAAADRFRVDHGILSANDTYAWLTARGLTPEAWSEDLRTRLRELRLLEHPTIAKRARATFEANPSSYAKINTGVVVVEDEGIAQEINLLLRETRTSFDTIARRYSILFAETVDNHPLSRRVLFVDEVPEPVAAVALAPDFHGPVDVPPVIEGELWFIYRIYAVERTAYDDETAEHLQRLALGEALQPHIVTAFLDLVVQLGCKRPPNPTPLAVLTQGQRYLASLRHERPARNAQIVRIERAARDDDGDFGTRGS